MTYLGSKVCDATLSLPITESRWLKSLNLKAILFRNIIIFVRERLESLHDVVGALIMLTVLRKINELQVWLFFQHGVGIDT